MLGYLLKTLRWIIVFALIFAVALVATMPVNIFLRALEKYQQQSLPLQQVDGYLWRGQGNLPYSGFNIQVNWQLCFVGRAPYLGVCWQLSEGDDFIAGSASTLDGKSISISETSGNLQLLRIIQNNPQLEMLALFNIDGVLQISIDEIKIVPTERILNRWEGVISLIEVQLPGISDLPRIDIILSTGRLNTNKREHASLGELPQFQLNGGNDSLRVEGSGFITPEREVETEVILQTTDRQLQSTLRLVGRPIGNNRFRLAWQGKY